MESANRIAFKEWAVVCAALASGRQSLILRKGGIHEGHDGFRVAHREFWLFPTGFHQEPDSVVSTARPLLAQILNQQPPMDEVHIRHYVAVNEVIEVHDESRLLQLGPWHIWSERTVHDRFHYKTPGLFVMLARVYELPEPVRIPVSPHNDVENPDELTGSVPSISRRSSVSLIFPLNRTLPSSITTGTHVPNRSTKSRSERISISSATGSHE